MVSLRREPCSMTFFMAFLRFLTLSSFNQAKIGPNCADDASVRGARTCAPRTGPSSAQLGPHFRSF